MTADTFAPIVALDPVQKGDMRHTYADTDRARADLGFAPSIDLERGLAGQQRMAFLRVRRTEQGHHAVAEQLGEEQADQVIAYTQKCVVVPLDTTVALLAADLHRAHKLATADAIVLTGGVSAGPLKDEHLDIPVEQVRVLRPAEPDDEDSSSRVLLQADVAARVAAMSNAIKRGEIRRGIFGATTVLSFFLL